VELLFDCHFGNAIGNSGLNVDTFQWQSNLVVAFEQAKFAQSLSDCRADFRDGM
jgi:hypothetical protein